MFLHNVFITQRDRLLGLCSCVCYILALTVWLPAFLAGTGTLLAYCIVERRLAKFKRLQGCGLVLGVAGILSGLILLIPYGTLISAKTTIQEITEVRETYNNDSIARLPESLQSCYASLERSWNTDLEDNAKEVFRNNCDVAIAEYSEVYQKALVRFLGCLIIGVCGGALAVVSHLQFERSQLHL